MELGRLGWAGRRVGLGQYSEPWVSCGFGMCVCVCVRVSISIDL